MATPPSATAVINVIALVVGLTFVVLLHLALILSVIVLLHR